MAKKQPIDCCHPDCLKCPYEDCVYNDITDHDRAEQNKYDFECKKERTPEEKRTMKKGKLSTYDYEQTDKRKESHRKYAQSEKGKETQRRYLKSDKGKEMQKRRAKRRWQKELARRDMEKWKQEVREYNKLHRYED